jgi:hypothetical protein
MFVPPMRIGQIVEKVAESLGKEDAEVFLQTCANPDVQKVLATIEAALTQNLTAIIVSEGVPPESLNLARYQFVAASSILTTMVQQGQLYASGKHPRFQRQQNAE